jgi:hypothetical protein
MFLEMEQSIQFSPTLSLIQFVRTRRFIFPSICARHFSTHLYSTHARQMAYESASLAVIGWDAMKIVIEYCVS